MPGDNHENSRTELLGKTWLANKLTQARIEIAEPARDIGVDLIAYDADVTWVLPIQLKVINIGGLRVESKYLGRRVGLVYVLLGELEGGPARRSITTAHLLTPEQAWSLPTEMSRKFDPDYHGEYGFGGLSRNLLARLRDFEVEDGTWTTRLSGLATALTRQQRSPAD